MFTIISLEENNYNYFTAFILCPLAFKYHFILFIYSICTMNNSQQNLNFFFHFSILTVCGRGAIFTQTKNYHTA